MKETKVKTCCICGSYYVGKGYNPYPFTTKGKCCEDCYLFIVIPEKTDKYFKITKKEKQKNDKQ